VGGATIFTGHDLLWSPTMGFGVFRRRVGLGGGNLPLAGRDETFLLYSLFILISLIMGGVVCGVCSGLFLALSTVRYRPYCLENSRLEWY